MSLVVTLNVFSGRTNPSWILAPNEEKELIDRLDAADELTNLKPPGSLGGLGYRGFNIQKMPDVGTTSSLQLYVHGGIIDRGLAGPSFNIKDRNLEEWLLQTAPIQIEDDVANHVLKELQKPVNLTLFSFAAPTACPTCHAADAPPYNPAKWNNASVQPYNNCYNYANDKITNTFAQPGNASGLPITGLTCAGVQPSAVSDGLKTAANFSAPLTSGHGWYVALVIWPGRDYHWYRQDSVGCWSHKPGSTQAQNIDNGGNRITDPATCDRGPYSDFCSYMATNLGVTIS